MLKFGETGSKLLGNTHRRKSSDPLFPLQYSWKEESTLTNTRHSQIVDSSPLEPVLGFTCVPRLTARLLSSFSAIFLLNDATMVQGKTAESRHAAD